MKKYSGPLVLACVAFAAAAATLAPSGAGPGVACDEPYHVAMSKAQWTALRQQGFSFFLPDNIERNYPWRPGGPPVQAPLGYWLLGLVHHVFDPAPDDPSSQVIAAARFAPALAFSLLVFFVGGWTLRRAGTLGGTVAAAAVLLMPRLFGHAHFAALDMLTTLFFTGAVLAAADAVRAGNGSFFGTAQGVCPNFRVVAAKRTVPSTCSWTSFALAGVVWGAAVLVRLHGLLAAPPVLLWLFWRSFRPADGTKPPVAAALRQGCVRGALWTASGAATVFLGWPWLWLDPVGRFRLYLASGTDRLPLHVFYAGQVWTDRDVPWHYPWVMFFVTVPVGLLLLGMIGLCRRGTFASPLPLETANEDSPIVADQRCASSPGKSGQSPAVFGGEKLFLAGTFLFLLLVFSWPGVPVYDGERLFLMAYPLWAIFVGLGAAAVARRIESNATHSRRQTASGKMFRNTAVLWVFVSLQGVGLARYCPCHLSYYNLLVGGLAGASRLGFEPTYWGETVREPLLAQAARRTQDAAVLFLPNLAPFQAGGVQLNSPSLQESNITLVGLDEAAVLSGRRFAIVYHRRADLAQAEQVLQEGALIVEYEIQGVWLARLLELPRKTSPPRRGVRES